MDRRLLEIVRCPVCGGKLSLTNPVYAEIAYSDGPRTEVEKGEATCACGRSYLISGFVLSFAQLFSPALQREAAFWERYYLWVVAQGSLGFHDLDLGIAPYISIGVPEPFPLPATAGHYTVHRTVAEHPLLRRGTDLLDVGVGLGWTSLHFARSGYRVTAIEPALGVAQAAKQYTIQQGIFIEYVCASLRTVSFAPASFHIVTAFHSLHHEPDLEQGMSDVRLWLVPGGALAVDEHVGNSRLAARMHQQMQSWAEEKVFPLYRALPPEVLAGLPHEPHSALEDSGSAHVIPLISRYFTVNTAVRRHTVLDHYPLLYYLAQGRDLVAFTHALQTSSQLQGWLAGVDPEGGDYITIIAENRPPATTPQPTAPQADAGDLFTESVEHARIAQLEAQLSEQGAWARRLERDLHRKTTEIARLHARGERRTRGLRGLLRRLQSRMHK